MKTNPSLRRLCGWKYRGNVSSEATFSKAFVIFAGKKVCDVIHAAVAQENYTEKLVDHASIDSTAIIGREKPCRKNTPKTKVKKKHRRKSQAEKAAIGLAPARKNRFRERSTVERGNSDLKDNYGARHIRVKGQLKVLCHLMFGVIAITVKLLFNILE